MKMDKKQSFVHQAKKKRKSEKIFDVLQKEGIANWVRYQ